MSSDNTPERSSSRRESIFSDDFLERIQSSFEEADGASVVALIQHRAREINAELLDAVCEIRKIKTEMRQRVLAMVNKNMPVRLYGVSERYAAFEGQRARVKGLDENGSLTCVVDKDETVLDGLRPRQICPIVNERDLLQNRTRTDCDDDDDDQSNGDAIESILTPGSVLVGSICIPGIMSETSRKSYVLTVLNPIEDDVFGLGKIVRFRHEAYGDVQSCHVHLRSNREFSDAETRCIVTSANRLRHAITGNVSQLKVPRGSQSAGEGTFFYEENKVTHTFVLNKTLGSSDETQRTLRRRLWSAKRKRLDVADKLFLFTENLFTETERTMSEDRSVLLRDIIAQIGGPDNEVHDVFLDIINDAHSECEDLCALIRRQAHILEHKTFRTDADRDTMLESMRRAKWMRGDVHRRVDVAIKRCHCAVRFFKDVVTISASDASRSDDAQRTWLGTNLETMCEKTHMTRVKIYRTNEAYSRFDRALRDAERRVSGTRIEAWQRTARSRSDLDGTNCVICMSVVGRSQAEDTAATLPCGHSFHTGCLVSWLRDKTSCPFCRYDLTKEGRSQE